MPSPRLPNLGAISDSEARRLLRQYLPIVRALRPLHPHLPDDELQAVGEDAILEAYLSHNGDRALESTWVRKVIHWRLAEAAVYQPPEHLEPDQVINGHDPELAVIQATAVSLIARLSPRHQNIVDGRMRGETYEEIAEQIGISAARTHIEAHKAFRLLRCMLEDEEQDDDDV